MEKRHPPTPVRFPENEDTLNKAKQQSEKLNISLNKYIVEAVKIRNKTGK